MPATPSAPRFLISALLTFSFLAALSAACGISYGSDDGETELFKRIDVTGELVTGGRVAFELHYEQPYPADIRALCALVAREGQDHAAPPAATNTPAPGVEPTPLRIPPPPPTPRNKVLDILDDQIPANRSVTPGPGTPVELLFKPGDKDNPLTPEPGSLGGEFTAPEEPGLYAIQCYTPVDTNNTITKEFRIAAR